MGIVLEQNASNAPGTNAGGSVVTAARIEHKEQVDEMKNRLCYCHNRSTYDRLFLAFIAGSGLNPSPPLHVIQSVHTVYISICATCAEHAMARVLNRLRLVMILHA